ncbi:hypothetical protein D3C85_1830830 [compost metagenome]
MMEAPLHWREWSSSPFFDPKMISDFGLIKIICHREVRRFIARIQIYLYEVGHLKRLWFLMSYRRQTTDIVPSMLNYQ